MFLPSFSTGDSYIFVKYMVCDHLHGKDPGGFHHQVARRTTGKIYRNQSNGTWNDPPLAEAMCDAGIEGM